jgi:hypothetical protein
VFSELAEEIRDGPGADAKRLGFILVRSTVAENPQGAVGPLIGRCNLPLETNRAMCGPTSRISCLRHASSTPGNATYTDLTA